MDKSQDEFGKFVREADRHLPESHQGGASSRSGEDIAPPRGAHSLGAAAFDL
jgi:hypothetical protein